MICSKSSGKNSSLDGQAPTQITRLYAHDITVRLQDLNAWLWVQVMDEGRLRLYAGLDRRFT
jgi:hypothetical protein